MADFNEDFIKFHDNIEVLKKDEKELVEFHINLNRHIKELNQLFEAFRFNLLNLQSSYKLSASDELIRNKEFGFEVHDMVAINALTISYISSGTTLITAIQVFLRKGFEGFPESFKVSERLKEEWIKQAHADNFHYRLLYELRNYSQHGYFPVSVNGSKYGFDLTQIMSTPYYTHNKRCKEEIESILAKYQEFSEYPRLSFTSVIIEYNLFVIRMYVDFLKEVRGAWRESAKRVKTLADQLKSNVFVTSDKENNLFVFSLDDGSSFNHIIELDDMIGMFNDRFIHARKIREYEESKSRIFYRRLRHHLIKRQAFYS